MLLASTWLLCGVMRSFGKYFGSVLSKEELYLSDLLLFLAVSTATCCYSAGPSLLTMESRPLRRTVVFLLSSKEAVAFR